MTNPKTLSQDLFAAMGKPQRKFYAIKNLADGSYLEIAYNLRSKKEVAKVMRDFLQSDTELLDYSEMTDKEFLNYIRYALLDQWTLESSKEPFPSHIFESL